jgi:hypothetical protein
MSHTPGPWTVGGIFPDGIEDKRAVTVDDGSKYHRRRTVATVTTPQNYADDHPEIEANARLISTAPELLEALTRIETFADDFADQFDLDELASRKIQAIIGLARAAIAKAKGEDVPA